MRHGVPTGLLFKNFVGNGKEGQVLNIGIVFNGVRHQMMNIVVTFPPLPVITDTLEGDTSSNGSYLAAHTKKGCHQHTSAPVLAVVLVHGVVANVVPVKGYLLPEQAQEQGGQGVRPN